MEKFKPNDLVVHETAPGVRGLVLGYEKPGWVMVCWETGYEAYTTHHEKDLEEGNVLDLLVEGRESEFRHEPTHSRCQCGRKLGVKQKQPFCTACNTFYRTKYRPRTEED